ncbi:MAG: hypothetical protein NUV59_01495 [Patescibacteria group bacterium]|nr:hypothetical protein [Patescibacteria group bacterium]
MPTKWMIWAIAALLIVAGAWYLLGNYASPKDVTPGSESAMQDESSVPEGTGAQPAASDSNVPADAALLDADLQAIDAQLEAAAESSASAEFDDQPIEQTE